MHTSRAPKSPELPPTPERQRRGCFVVGPAVATDDEPARAGVRVYRALSPLDRLLKSGVIESRQHEAGIRLRADYEIGILGAREAASGSTSSTGNHYTDVQLDAARRAKLAIVALGPTAFTVRFIAVHDYSIAELARHIGGRRQEIAGILKLGLTALADHYVLTS